MDVDIPYGKKQITISISEPVEILFPKKIDVTDENKIIKQALENPTGMETFEQFAKKAGLSVSEIMRRALDEYLDKLKEKERRNSV